MAEGISKILNKRSNVSGKKPTNLEYGEIAINYASGNEAIIIKNSDDQMVEFKANPTIDTTQFVTLDTEQTISGEKNFLGKTTFDNVFSNEINLKTSYQSSDGKKTIKALSYKLDEDDQSVNFNYIIVGDPENATASTWGNIDLAGNLVAVGDTSLVNDFAVTTKYTSTIQSPTIKLSGDTINLAVYDDTNSFTPTAALNLYSDGYVNTLGEWGFDDIHTQSVSANTFIKLGGTSSQVLMADGSAREVSTLCGEGGNIDTSNLVTTNTKQTISAPKEFESDVTIGNAKFSKLNNFTNSGEKIWGFSGLSVTDSSRLYVGKDVDGDTIHMFAYSGYFNFSDFLRIRTSGLNVINPNNNSYNGPHTLQFGIDNNTIDVTYSGLDNKMGCTLDQLADNGHIEYAWYYRPNGDRGNNKQLMSLDETSTLTVDKIVTSIDGGEF